MITRLESVTLAVGILGDEATAPNVHRLLAPDNPGLSASSVRWMLRDLRGATVEVAVPGDRARSGQQATRWRLTEAARAWLAGECGEPQ